MSRESVLAAGQRFAEATLTDICTVNKVRWNTDDTTLVTTMEILEQHYPDPDDDTAIGVCKVDFGTSRVTEPTPGDQPIALENGTLHLPVDTSGAVVTDDVAVIVSSQSNPNMVGRTFRIKGPFHQSYATAHRFPIQEES